MNSELLLIVGASARAAAYSARRAGFEVLAVDAFADADLQAVARAESVADFPRGIIEAAGKLPTCDWLYVGGLENHPAVVDLLADDRRLLGNRGDSLQRARDPFDWLRGFQSAGFSFPEITREPPFAESDSWLVKNCRSSGGLSVAPFRSSMAASPDVYFQRRVNGTSYGVVYIGDDNSARMLGVTEQLHSPSPDGRRPFRYGGSIGPWRPPAAVAEQLRMLGEFAASEYRLRGLFGIDVLFDGRGSVWPLEINPRYTASVEILERASSTNAIALHVEACRSARIDQVGDDPALNSAWHGKQVVYADRCSGRMPESLAELLLAINCGSHRPQVADIPAAGSEIARGAPLATVFAEADTRTELLTLLAHRAAALRERFSEWLQH